MYIVYFWAFNCRLFKRSNFRSLQQALGNTVVAFYVFSYSSIISMVTNLQISCVVANLSITLISYYSVVYFLPSADDCGACARGNSATSEEADPQLLLPQENNTLDGVVNIPQIKISLKP